MDYHAQIMNLPRPLFATGGYDMGHRDARHAAAEIAAEADGKIDGLEADLKDAVRAAWNYGAEDWVKANYPDMVEDMEAI